MDARAKTETTNPETTKPGADPIGFLKDRAASLAVLAGLLVLAALPVFGSIYVVGVATEILILAMFAASLGFLMGFPRLISLGHAAFFGGGAYAAGIVAERVGANLFLTLAVALVFSTLLAVVIGALSLRNVGIYFLMITLALAQLVYVIAQQWTSLTGGTNGLVGVPYPELFGIIDFNRSSFFYLVLLLAGAVYVLLRAVTRSPFGHILIGIGSNERRMRAIGYSPQLYKLVAFVLAGAVAGIAGALWAHYNGIVAPVDLHWSLSATALIMVIVGGSGTLIGPMLGAALVWFMDTGLGSYTERSTMITGAVFILFVFFARGGIVGIFQSLRRSGK